MATDFSTLLNCAMDCIGFSKSNIVSRAKTFNKVIDICSQTCTERIGMEMILAGSKSEGVVPFHASDYDIMFVFNHFLCVDIGCQEDGLLVIETYNKDCPPGYTQLRPINLGNVDIPYSLDMCSVYDISKGVILLTSTGFQQIWAFCNEVIPPYQGFEKKDKSVAGPAISTALQAELIKGLKSANVYGDYVPAIRLYSSSILQEWKERERIFEWPSSDDIQNVSTMEGFVVPVGHKDSEEQRFEWRICFTTAEKKLISSLNAIQLKLYILFKIVNRDIIKPKVDCVSSYLVKNIILWVAESFPLGIFTPAKLTHMLIQSLRFLLHCLNNNHLPNYMIPSRNLLLGKIKSEQKPKLKSILREILNEGEKIVLQCDKLKNAMYIVNCDCSLANRFRLWRDEIEEIHLFINLKVFSKLKPNMALQSSFVYDMLFEFWKDESCMTNLVRLLTLLAIDSPTTLANGLRGLDEIGTWMDNLFS